MFRVYLLISLAESGPHVLKSLQPREGLGRLEESAGNRGYVGAVTASFPPNLNHVQCFTCLLTARLDSMLFLTEKDILTTSLHLTPCGSGMKREYCPLMENGKRPGPFAQGWE